MIAHSKSPRSRSRKARRLIAVGAILGVGLVGTALTQAVALPQLAPLITKSVQATIPDQYIVVFVSGTSDQTLASAQTTARNLGATIGFTYTSALRGFSVKAPPATIEQLRTIAGVSYIEADGRVSVNTVQNTPPLGLDRISERPLPLDNRYTYDTTGLGVHVYVIDTGILSSHAEFGSRVSGGVSEITDPLDTYGTQDCHGHGTHVAGTIGGHIYGIAKDVQLHPVRVLDCSGDGAESAVIAGIDWVTIDELINVLADPTYSAVANLSLVDTFPNTLSLALNMAVETSVASGVTYVVAAGNNSADACSFSPASAPSAITVGSIYSTPSTSTTPNLDVRSSFSNFGPCIDLFAPGENILSAGVTSNTATATLSGTSTAAPHVAGIAARWLETHKGASPAAVWAAIHYADNVPTTPGWPGVVNPGPGSPNEVLHYGSRNDGADDGDPHLKTIEGVAYDFQGAGEFVLLREANGLEIQTRQRPVATASAVTNGYTGLTSCVSLNTAVAARVGSHRISYEPNLSGVPDPSSLQLRIDGVLTTPTSAGTDLGGGGRVASYTSGGITVDFPDGTTLFVTPLYWMAHGIWYLNVSVAHSSGNEGLIGARPSGSWLPALPGGGSMGPIPSSLHQRYLDLNATFANAWRVTPSSSLFDYAPGTSTSTFTIAAWPPETPPCVIPQSQDPPIKPLDPSVAQQLCRALVDPVRNDACVKDVTVTANPGFATIHRISEAIANGATQIQLNDAASTTPLRANVTFTAVVRRHTGGNGAALPTGSVVFSIDGNQAGEPIPLNSTGSAVWKSTSLASGQHRVSAAYTPTPGTTFLSSTSAIVTHIVQ